MLYNVSKKKTILNKVKIADTEFKQALGLMFSRRSKFNYCLIFSRPTSSIIGSSIHMMFVFYPITVIFLDENKKVVDIKKKVIPFWFYAPKKPAKYILEMPTSTNINSVNVNDRFKW
ncbi:MAG: DUF192 domain-containing protein [archaeon]